MVARRKEKWVIVLCFEGVADRICFQMRHGSERWRGTKDDPEGFGLDNGNDTVATYCIRNNGRMS